ncbi:hypothetical protein GCM10027521_49270 [Amycolatopsis cihanbeyliensis]
MSTSDGTACTQARRGSGRTISSAVSANGSLRMPSPAGSAAVHSAACNIPSSSEGCRVKVSAGSSTDAGTSNLASTSRSPRSTEPIGWKLGP